MNTHLATTVGKFAGELNDPVSAWLREVFLKPNNSNVGAGTWGVDNAFIFITWINIVFFFVVVGPMCWWTWKYRRRLHVPAVRTPNHNTVLEVTWVTVPLIILTGLFFWGFQGFMRAEVAVGGSQIINVEGRKWNWIVTYPNGAQSPLLVYLDDHTHLPSGSKGKPIGERGNTEIPIFVVPEGTPIKFMLKSQDVMHSFYIPDMRVKMDLFPNRYTSMTFIPRSAAKPAKSEVGHITELPEDKDIVGSDHYVFCAEYCGQQHSEMAAILRVVSMATYNATLAEWASVEDKLAPKDLGEYIHKRQCVTCHTIDGTKNTGPTWKGSWGTEVKFADGSTLLTNSDYSKSHDPEEAWRAYSYESINYPSKKLHEGFQNQMTPFTGQFSTKQLNGIQAYFRFLAGKSLPEDLKVPEKKPKTP